MGIIKEVGLSTQSTNQAIYKVIQAQQALAVSRHHPDLMKYLDRDTWQLVARALTEHFWPRTVKDDLYIQEDIEKLYLAGLALIPIASQCPGFWMPWRHNGHLASWLKQYAHKRYEKRMLMTQKWDWSEALSRLEENAAALGIVDKGFIEMCSELISRDAYADSARGHLARKIFGPLVFNADALNIYRHARANHGVTWWDEGAACVLSRSKIFTAKGTTTLDLTKRTATIWNYSVTVKMNSLILTLSDAFVKQTKASIISILSSSAGPQRKIHAISSCLETFCRWAKHSPNTGPQRKLLEDWVRQKMATKLLAENPRLEQHLFDIAKAPWDPKYYPRGQSGLLDKSLTLDKWLKWWGPRR
ncbi:MAG: hypothetical protein EOM03_06250 [Clostridia bacterium]|nr:hypothetical protein [Clostridia bacterium]